MSARVLVLEDDDGIRASLAMALEDEGYQVLQYAEAESALHAVRAAGVDLMLVDLMLGGPGRVHVHPAGTPGDPGTDHRRQRPERNQRHRRGP
jgi:DNA-binding NtrC family response regulator